MSKKIITFLLVLFTIFALICVPAGVSLAMDDDETSGLQADTLAINVGYFGFPYYQKKVFTVDELVSLGLVSAVYSYIDNMPAVCLDYAKGVPISTIMNAAGIDINSIQRFYFYTNDNKGGYFTDFTKKSLLDTTRYYYPNLVFRYYELDYDPDEYDEQAAKGAIPVQAMMAVSDNWVRHLPGPDDFGEIDYSVQRTLTRFRLMFGQENTYTRTASKSAKWVHSIDVMLGGSPTIKTDVSVLEKEVGSKYRVTATVIAADDLFAENLKQSLVWSTSDSSVATVDNKGNVTITGDGTADITISFQGKELGRVQVKGGKGDSDKPSDDDKDDPDPPADEDGATAGTKPPSGGKGKGLPNAKMGGGQTAATNKQVKKVTRLKPEDIPENIIDIGASTNTVFALRLGNASRADGLLSILAGGEENHSDQGAVQNWRKTEMADTAVPLGQIDDHVSMQTVLFGSLALFLIAIIGRITEFYLEI